MRRLILFLIFVVNLHIACNNDAVGVDFGSIAYAQQMTYEAQGQECEGDDLSPDYWSSMPCEFDGGITDKDLSGIDWYNILAVPVAVEGGFTSLIQYSAEADNSAFESAIKNAKSTLPKEIADKVAREIMKDASLTRKIINTCKTLGVAGTLFSAGSLIVGWGDMSDAQRWLNVAGLVTGGATLVYGGTAALALTGISFGCSIIVCIISN